jgi:hypothetical protein
VRKAIFIRKGSEKMGRIGRPPKVDLEELINGVDDYIENANPPIVAEYAHKNGITRQRLYSLAEEKKRQGDERLFDAIKKLSESKEISLERGGLSGNYSANMAIFSLKQLGWTDKAKVDVYAGAKQEDDPLTKSLKELAKEMDNNADQ